jgi:threonine dehydratase
MNITTFSDILHARTRLAAHLKPTPLEESAHLGKNIWFKLENLNQTRSFKIRGALNAMLSLSEDEKSRGIVAASAGNHAQGVAYAARLAEVNARVVMPTKAPERKVKGTQRLGAEVVLFGDTYDDAEEHARKLQSQIGMTFISPYNDRQVVAGAGTIGLELFDELPGLERVVIPTSGGGLMAGIGLACKTLNPEVEVVGVQSVATPAMHNFLYDTHYPQKETIADGLSGEIEDGSITFSLCKQFTDQMVLVDEAQIEEAVRWVLKMHNWVIEGAGAVGVAALLSGELAADGRQTALIISGANIDYDKLKRLLA